MSAIWSEVTLLRQGAECPAPGQHTQISCNPGVHLAPYPDLAVHEQERQSPEDLVPLRGAQRHSCGPFHERPVPNPGGSCDEALPNLLRDVDRVRGGWTVQGAHPTPFPVPPIDFKHYRMMLNSLNAYLSMHSIYFRSAS